MKTRTPSVLITFALACFALTQNTQAVSPPPDGGYPGGNTAEGYLSLGSLTTSTYNTAVGIFSLESLTTGSFCTGLGAGTLLANTADENTATGAGALLSNTTGDFNTANGAFALFSNTTGFNNTAIGAAALLNNVGGARNNAFGSSALHENVAGPLNSAHGSGALFSNTSSCCDNAFGDDALSNSTGFGNTAVGDLAGIGVTTHNNIIAIGAGVSGVDTALGEVDNSCYIGNISGASVDAGAFNFVLVDADGKLGTVAVDANGNKMAVPTPQGAPAPSHASQSRGTGSEHRSIEVNGCSATERNGSFDGPAQRAGRANPKGERPA